MALTQQLEGYMREAVIREAAGDLAQTQVEKLRSLVESLDFEDEESFAHKVKTVKESYFAKEISTEVEEIVEDWSDDAVIVESSSSMDRYLQAIKKANKE